MVDLLCKRVMFRIDNSMMNNFIRNIERKPMSFGIVQSMSYE